MLQNPAISEPLDFALKAVGEELTKRGDGVVLRNWILADPHLSRRGFESPNHLPDPSPLASRHELPPQKKAANPLTDSDDESILYADTSNVQ